MTTPAATVQESADLMFTIYEVIFQDPVALLALFIDRPHRKVAVRMNV